MKPIENSYAPFKDTCLKYFDHKSYATVIDENTAGVVEENGHKFLKAGTPFPSNDADCKGYVLHTYDVTNGSQSAAIIFEGSIDNKILVENGVTVSEAAKAATPRVTFFD